MITLIGHVDAPEMLKTIETMLRENFHLFITGGDVYFSEHIVEVIQEGYEPWSGKISAWCYINSRLVSNSGAHPQCYGKRTVGSSNGQFKVGDTVKPKVCSEMGISL